ncbi:MAG: L-serine ammonia-lyase [Sandaracinaceae bacterium]
MAISAFDMFTIGVGPSSSHTVGPMRAALRCVAGLRRRGLFERTATVRVELFGSLGATGKGHGSDRAVLSGLEGETPETVDVDRIPERMHRIEESGALRLDGERAIPFRPREDLLFHRRRSLPGHPNGMRYTAFDGAGAVLLERVFYSVGGGFVVDDQAADEDRIVEDRTELPHPFTSGAELRARCAEAGLPISGVMLANEQAWRPLQEVEDRLDRIWSAMQDCVERGCQREGVLPGGLKVRRRAAGLYQQLRRAVTESPDALLAMDWVNLFALAVNEENAAGGRVVTAPTNGAAGIVPAVLHYYSRFVEGATQAGVRRFLLTAAAIGIIFKTRASISGAEVGCQGEVGVACSMAAAGLAEVLGGTPSQAECAAEIGMEHNLGLTCDPVGGLVQVPCIERNAMGAVKAINAARLALRGDGDQKVSLDQVIETMRQTGADMKTKYKETARGGLAVNIIEC